ncbi:MAG: TRAP transporter substrate-binding protein DctP, partial [Gammaproteobacteria bacterium]|nr:TRAP transporter substrate-binding protein DctP [Gammaproteobacteria bacterium]
DSAKEIKERTDGRVQIKYYGGGVMGNDTKVLGKIRIGALQGGAFTPAALADSYPNLNIYGMPLVFDSEEEAAYVRERLDGKLQEGLEAAGFVNFGFASGGFAIVMSNTPVKSLEDLKGKRVWVPEGDSISYASMEALSLAPVTLPLTDVLTGLQTGLIDIVAMSPIGALVLQWHTKIKYVTEIPLVYTVGFMAIDRRAFSKLSDADQQIVREVMKKTYKNFDRVNLEDNREARDALLNTGIESVAFDAQEVARLRERLLESNRRLGAKGAFDMALYDEMMGYVEEYREADSEAVAGSQ